MSTTVRASERAHGVLRKLSDREGISMVEALDRITADWEKKEFFRALNDSFAKLRSDPEAWAGEEVERRLWEQTLTDGLDDDDHGDAEPG